MGKTRAIKLTEARSTFSALVNKVYHDHDRVIVEKSGIPVAAMAKFLEFGETEFLPGDGLLICSDGLSDMVTKEQMTKVFKEQVKAPAIVTDLIALANVAGGNDNITVVVAKNLSRRKKVVRSESVSAAIPALPVQMQVAPVALIKKSPFPIVGSVILGAIIIIHGILVIRKKDR